MALITRYRLEIFTPPCDPGAERYSAAAHLPDSIAELLPYLNATLEGVKYLPSVPALTWKKGHHLVAFHADRVAVSNVVDRDEALQELEAVIELANRTWARRAEITPSHQAHKAPAPMAVFKLLPRTNCGECGEMTCMAFAFGLIQGSHRPADCPYVNPAGQGALASLL
jgi:ArsR family metal-binding transcriptional regulator